MMDYRREVLQGLKEKGILKSDPRLKCLVNAKTPEDIEHEKETCSLLRDPSFIIPDFKGFCEKIEEIYECLKEVEGGSLPTYIPELAEADPDLLGISLCTIDGQRQSFGDTSVEFCLQSCCKPILYAMALEELGERTVHTHVGKEPSGRSFNDIALSPKGIPFNPMINMGAIMMSSLIHSSHLKDGQINSSRRYTHLLTTLNNLTGGTAPVSLSGSTYLCEKATADRNRGLAYIMKETSDTKPTGFPIHVKDGDDIEDVLDFYFMACSMQTTCDGVAAMAATLANGGICPFTGIQVFSPESVKYVLSITESCGLYDWSGEGKVVIGLPVKSGVSGILMIIVPGIAGFCVYSPPLDVCGNSVKGIEFCVRLTATYPFHSFEHIVPQHGKEDPRCRKHQDTKIATWMAIDAAGCGDLNTLKSFHAREFDLNLSDYDGRTPLHLAAASGSTDVVNFLVNVCRVDQTPKDRWGHTPQDEAKEYEEILKLLSD